jgi:hypothetical protein
MLPEAVALGAETRNLGFGTLQAVDAEHVLEVAAAEDEDPVEAVGAPPCAS